MIYNNDNRIVMTLDAGGTNLVFSAIQSCEQIVDEIKIPTNSTDLEKCLNDIIEGFTLVKEKLPKEPVAISFAFPGPADYPNGIIGDLPNLSGFRGGVALGPMLSAKFNLPVFINNDGDLYAYGESIAGFLPEINKLLEDAGSPKRYKNLLGLTLGTGFGAGIVRDNNLFIGDNSIAGEIWLTRNKIYPKSNIEESASIRAILRDYKRFAEIDNNNLTPKDIYEIAIGKQVGNKDAALKAYDVLGEAIGDAISNAITLIDGLIVIGGGLSAAHSLFLQKTVDEMNGFFEKEDGTKFKRLVANVYNLEGQIGRENFVKGKVNEIDVPFSNKKIFYDSEMRIGIGISKIGTSKAIAIGAYAFALQKIDSNIVL